MTLREQAEAIWNAGVSAVNSATLVSRSVVRTATSITICDEEFPLKNLSRIVVVGAGKAGAGMAAGFEAAIGSDLALSKLVGWVNVPADCVRSLQKIHLHAARPAGINEPTIDGVRGTERILQLVQNLTGNDLCVVLLSGGGSALLPAPIDGISLDDKRLVTQSLMQSGANIGDINTVRKRLSRIKGGGLARAARAGRMMTLIISDVIDDPLDIIASGPTVHNQGTAQDAVAVLERYLGRDSSEQVVPESVWRVLDKQVAGSRERDLSFANSNTVTCSNRVIGNNLTALNAAADEARRLGLDVRILGANRGGTAREVGIELAERCLVARDERRSQGICFLGGGEPVVKLAVTNRPRRGGRNQEVSLAAGVRWVGEKIERCAVFSAGTDGEDGPTDAAGACFDADVQQVAVDRQLSLSEFLAINDSYTFFEQTKGLFKTGPTHTNVMDLQIAIVAGIQTDSGQF